MTTPSDHEWTDLFRRAPEESVLRREPWLTDRNSWCLASDPDRHQSVHERGAWCVGNGRVFAHAGLAKPFNTLQGIVGPSYQTRGDHAVDGAFGDCWIEVLVDGSPVGIEREFIWRPRASGVLCTAGVLGPGVLSTVDFVPPEENILVRLVELWGDVSSGSSVRLLVPRAAAVPSEPGLISATYGDDMIMVVGAPGSEVTADAGALCADAVRIDRLHVRVAFVLAFGDTVSSAVRAFAGEDDALAALRLTRAFWRDWLETTSTPQVPARQVGTSAEASPSRILDLIETTKVNLKMQQSLPGGGVSPMVHFKGTWARDNNGPVRAFLAMGAYTEARAVMDYYYRACAVLGRIGNSVPLNVDVCGVQEPISWSDVPMETVEVPSWIILQHRWWLERTGDESLVREHWDYLRRCAMGQGTTPEGMLPFHGDETYLLGALYSIVRDERATDGGDLLRVSLDGGAMPWSLDSMTAFVAALEAMAWMAPRIGRGEEVAEFRPSAARVRQVIESRFWMTEHQRYAPALYPPAGDPHPAPFAPVNLRPVWLRYHTASDPRSMQNLDAVVREVGWTGISPGCGFNVGTTPAYLLWDLVEMRSDLAGRGLDNLLSFASPAGDFAEVYGPGGRPTGGYSLTHPNRLRPWESGLALDSIYHYYAKLE